jgi:hypothetical protein
MLEVDIWLNEVGKVKLCFVGRNVSWGYQSSVI